MKLFLVFLVVIFMFSGLAINDSLVEDTNIVGDAKRGFITEETVVIPSGTSEGMTTIKGYFLEEGPSGGPDPAGSFGPIVYTDGEPSTFKKVVNRIISIGSLSFLFGNTIDGQLCGFIRILLSIIVFTLIYLGLSMIPHMPRNISIVIGIVLAILTAIFTPCVVLMAFGETYAVIFALIIIGGPIIGILALCFLTPTPRWPHALLKFLAICFVMWLIAKISLWAQVLSGA
jgi:hypothetical protein